MSKKQIEETVEKAVNDAYLEGLLGDLCDWQLSNIVIIVTDALGQGFYIKKKRPFKPPKNKKSVKSVDKGSDNEQITEKQANAKEHH